MERNPGWSWVHSRYSGMGSVKYKWNNHPKILESWAVTKKGNRPFQLIGEFVETVLQLQARDIKSIHIALG